MEWMSDFYAKRYGWADRRTRWADFDLRLLLEGTGLNLDSVEPYADESYGASSPVGDAMLYLARLVPK